MEPMTGSCDVGELAWHIEKIYTARVRSRGRAWEHYTPGARWTVCWNKAASICLEYGFDPEAHVRALFEGWPASDHKERRNPWPNMLVGDRAIFRTQQFLRSVGSDELRRLRSQLGYLQGRINSGFNVVAVLTDPEQDLCAAIRYAFAVNAGLPSVASRFRDAARLELRLSPERRALIAKMLPPTCTEVLYDGVGR